MAALPYQGSIIVPVQWQVAVAKQTMQAGSYRLSGTVGFRPWTEMASIEWILPKDQALDLLNQLKTGMYNAVYDYTCNTRGAVRVRPTDQGTFQERRGGQWLRVSCTFETV